MPRAGKDVFKIHTHNLRCYADLRLCMSLQSFQLRNYKRDVCLAKFHFISHPIIEMAPPDDAALTDSVVEDCATRLQRGEVLAVHCRGGVGRAGLMAACMLARLGVVKSADDAIAWVSSTARTLL